MAKHAGGRPPKFDSVEALQKQIDKYFKGCEPKWVKRVKWEHPRDSKGNIDYTKDQIRVTVRVQLPAVPYTITGLAMALQTTRETLIDYENGNRDLDPEDEEYDPQIPKFSDTIKDAKLRCENYAELQLYSGRMATGPIFNLKNNYRWKDTAEVVQDQNITVITRGSGNQPAGNTKHTEAEDEDDD